MPQPTLLTAPLELLMIHHCPVDGRQTARSVLPSPSKSAGTRMSVLVPQLCELPLPVELLMISQKPVEGRHTLMSALPSPSKSDNSLAPPPVMAATIASMPAALPLPCV